jgi:nitrate reductase NapAB chaperone NapD
MAISGIVVVPTRGKEDILLQKLNGLQGAEVQAVGPKGIAAVLEAHSPEALEQLTRTIQEWEEVVDVQLAYYGLEEIEES